MNDSAASIDTAIRDALNAEDPRAVLADLASRVNAVISALDRSELEVISAFKKTPEFSEQLLSRVLAESR